MKIAIDVSQVVYGTGVSVYMRNLVQNLLKIDNENEYLLFAGVLRRKKDLMEFFRSLEGAFETKVVPLPPWTADIFWNRYRGVKIERFIGKIDILHSSDWSQPPTDAYKVTTVHDLVPFKFPQLTSQRLVDTHKRSLEIIKKEADVIIVPSSSTETDLIKMGFDGQNIKVIAEAPNENFSMTDERETENIRKKYRIGGDYLLAIGVNPRKNLTRIIDAYELVKSSENNKRVRNMFLVAVGHAPSTIIAPRGVRFVGYVPDSDLAALYTGASVLVYPSLYEGFGLPILEAFKCEVPVVTSSISSLAEVAGKAAVMVDPYSVEDIARGIVYSLKNKRKLVRKGLTHVKKYSWEKAARETLEVYRYAKEGS